MKSALRAAAACTLVLLPGTAFAEDAAPADATTDSKAFELGQIVVQAPVQQDAKVGASSVSHAAIEAFDRNTLDDAANLIPGVNSSNTGGSRNERVLYVRGFDRFQVPLSIDGIRVYLPADNRLDYGRFLTQDIAEIQVAKGYASVLDGPGAMGGAVNLVTMKPAKAFEAEARATLDLDSDLGYAGYTAFALLGTKHDTWYAQASFARNFTDHWDLPDSFVQTNTGEDGGERDLSRNEDWRLNAKIGFTPNATDEYSLSYTRQEGSKNAPLSTVDDASIQKNWTWPWWNIDSIYFLSRTALGDSVTLKTRAYRNGFDNLLSAFDDASETTQTKGRSFNSYYEDVAWGGSAQLDYTASAADTLSFAAHFRRDRHVEFQQSFPAGTTEPPQHNEEDTWSVAAQNVLALSPTLTFTAGASYDWRDLHKAEEYGTPPGGGPAAIFSYPLKNSDAWNGQGRLDYRPNDTTRLYALVSSRARFPTIFERFSSRFGGAVSSPDLQAERATNFEVGAETRTGPFRLSGAVFYSRLNHTIVAFPGLFYTCTNSFDPPATPTPGCTGQSVTQSRNLGSGDYYGAEVSVDGDIGPTLTIGANYTWVHRNLNDPTNASFEATGVPDSKAFLYLDWHPLPGLRILPNLDLASDRWSTNTAGTLYLRTGSYVTANMTVDYDVTDHLTIGAGVKNAFDELYSLSVGFPEPGRRFFLTASWKN